MISSKKYKLLVSKPRQCKERESDSLLWDYFQTHFLCLISFLKHPAKWCTGQMIWDFTWNSVLVVSFHFCSDRVVPDRPSQGSRCLWPPDCPVNTPDRFF